MIRTIFMLGFWIALLPVAALIGFPWTLLTGNVAFLYRIGMWGAWTGIRIAGVRAKTVGLDKLDPARTYIFMSNHVSNIDPPLLLPLIPKRTSVMAIQPLPGCGRISGSGTRAGVSTFCGKRNSVASSAITRSSSGVWRGST